MKMAKIRHPRGINKMVESQGKVRECKNGYWVASLFYTLDFGMPYDCSNGF